MAKWVVLLHGSPREDGIGRGPGIGPRPASGLTARHQTAADQYASELTTSPPARVESCCQTPSRAVPNDQT